MKRNTTLTSPQVNLAHMGLSFFELTHDVRYLTICILSAVELSNNSVHIFQMSVSQREGPPHILFKFCFVSGNDTTSEDMINNNVPVQIQLLGQEKPQEMDGFIYFLNKD